MLKEADPTGEEEVCIDNQPVWFVQRMPAYYDGRLVRYEPPLPLDEEEGMRIPDKMHFISDGAKIEIMYYEWRSVMWDSEGKIELGRCPSDHTKGIVDEERQKVFDFMDGREDRIKRLEEKRNEIK